MTRKRACGVAVAMGHVPCCTYGGTVEPCRASDRCRTRRSTLTGACVLCLCSTKARLDARVAAVLGRVATLRRNASSRRSFSRVLSANETKSKKRKKNRKKKKTAKEKKKAHKKKLDLCDGDGAQHQGRCRARQCEGRRDHVRGRRTDARTSSPSSRRPGAPAQPSRKQKKAKQKIKNLLFLLLCAPRPGIARVGRTVLELMTVLNDAIEVVGTAGGGRRLVLLLRCRPRGV